MKIPTNINSFSSLVSHLANYENKEKGDLFENITQFYLRYSPKYKSKLARVWNNSNLPPSIARKLNIPLKDHGIDLIAETVDGYYWAIQCKYLSDTKQTLSHRKLSTFLSLSKGIAKNIKYHLIATTTDDYSKLYKNRPDIGVITSEDWNKLDKDFFDGYRAYQNGKKVVQKPYSPRDHQKSAIKNAVKHFQKEGNSRGKLIFPCGAGKSLAGYWITEKLKAEKVIVAVPSLSLVKQTLDVYLREAVANKKKVQWLCVCSDEGIGKNDDVAIHTSDIGVPCVTDVDYIAKWLRKHKNDRLVVFTTYQSGKVIAEASKKASVKYDVGIMDEAHKTVGDKSKLFSHLLFDKNIRISNRLFMTATERSYKGSSNEILSMDNPEIYGETFEYMSFADAMASTPPILCDYKIITLGISNSEVQDLIKENAYVKPTKGAWNHDVEARTLASLIAIRKAMLRYPIKHAVSFHSSIAKADAFAESQQIFSNIFSEYRELESFHVTGAMPTAQRTRIVNEFSSSKRSLITNAKCLTEGVDVPGIDCVLFVDPRKSTVDIVQAIGRALRRSKGKKYGYVILPIFINSEDNTPIDKTESFKEVLVTLRKLASNDERIIEWFRDNAEHRQTRNKDLIEFDIDVSVSDKIDESELIDEIELSIWNRLAKLSWRNFAEAREYIRGLKLKNRTEWREFCVSGKKPSDIPSNPDAIYAKYGYINLNDWLGTNNVTSHNRTYYSFEEAKIIVRRLGIKTWKDWVEYCSKGDRDLMLPSHPNSVYKKKGWQGWPDFLGTNRKSTKDYEYISFEEARRFARQLKLNNTSEWWQYCKSGKKPSGIPYNPRRQYSANGWVDWSDWLGNSNIASQKMKFLDYEKARKYVQHLSLKSTKEYIQWARSSARPSNIPKAPDQTYRNKGWISWPKFLGSSNNSTNNRNFYTYSKARAYIKKFGLKNSMQWREWSKTSARPARIPSAPDQVYRNNGWISWPHWLGKED